MCSMNKCDATETAKLHQDLQKVEQLDAKISTELDTLKKKITMMTSELETYSDLHQLRADAETKKQARSWCNVSNKEIGT